MKVLVASLLLAGSSLASAEAVMDWQAFSNQRRSACVDTRTMSCVPQLYNCGDYWAEVDLCEDGSYYLRGTDIPFRCESRGD
jgi:hypothetical protein